MKAWRCADCGKVRYQNGRCKCGVLDLYRVQLPLVRFLDGEGEPMPPDKERTIHATAGACAGSEFGWPGDTEIQISHDDGKTWEDWGMLVTPYADPWRYLKWGPYPNEEQHDLRARTSGSAIKKARKFVREYEAKPVW